MKALFSKKIIIRLMIAELIITLIAFALTPYLFGSIKPFNPKIKSTNDSQLIKTPKSVVLALKKASKKSVIKKSSAKAGSVSVDKKKKKKSKKVKKQNIVTISGVLSKVQIDIYMQGSHRINGGGKTTLAYSSKISLSQYEGKNVKATGTIKETVEGNGKIIQGTDAAKTYVINITSIQVL